MALYNASNSSIFISPVSASSDTNFRRENLAFPFYSVLSFCKIPPRTSACWHLNNRRIIRKWKSIRMVSPRRMDRERTSCEQNSPGAIMSLQHDSDFLGSLCDASSDDEPQDVENVMIGALVQAVADSVAGELATMSADVDKQNVSESLRHDSHQGDSSSESVNTSGIDNGAGDITENSTSPGGHYRTDPDDSTTKYDSANGITPDPNTVSHIRTGLSESEQSKPVLPARSLDLARLSEQLASLSARIANRPNTPPGKIQSSKSTAGKENPAVKLAGVESRTSNQEKVPAVASPKNLSTSVREEVTYLSQLEARSSKSSSQSIDRSELTAMRFRLNKKLSEANAYNRHLQREVHKREDALRECASELLLVQLELKELVALAKEAAMAGSKASTRIIAGRPLASHVVFKLEEMQETLGKRVEGVEGLQVREVPIEWQGMAEDVKVMGSFDGWTRGEQMSPESTNTYTKFTANIKLPAGSYEVKFLVDGEWRLAPNWPTVGSGLTANNILVVD